MNIGDQPDNRIFLEFDFYMYIAPEEYLELTDRLALYRRRWEQKEDELTQLQEKCFRLEERLKHMQEKTAILESKENQHQQQIIKHVTSKSEEVSKDIHAKAEEQKAFLIKQILEMSQDDPMLKKLKDLEKKMADEKAQNKETGEFYNKVKALYHTNSRMKGSLTAGELFDWVKANIPGPDLSKTMMSSKMGNSRKQLTSSKLGTSSKPPLSKQSKADSQQVDMNGVLKSLGNFKMSKKPSITDIMKENMPLDLPIR